MSVCLLNFLYEQMSQANHGRETAAGAKTTRNAVEEVGGDVGGRIQRGGWEPAKETQRTLRSKLSSETLTGRTYS